MRSARTQAKDTLPTEGQTRTTSIFEYDLLQAHNGSSSYSNGADLEICSWKVTTQLSLKALHRSNVTGIQNSNNIEAVSCPRAEQQHESAMSHSDQHSRVATGILIISRHRMMSDPD